MKYLLLYYLKSRHDKALDKHHGGWLYYKSNWRNVIKWRNRIRRIEPDFLKGFD